MSALEDLVQAALNAPSQRREAALQVLRGQLRAVDPHDQALTSEPYITLRQVAKRLGFSTATLFRWRVPGHALGGRPRYRLSEVEAYLKTDAFQRRVAALRAERKGRAAALSGHELSVPIVAKDSVIRNLKVNNSSALTLIS
jgi:predicted DNA-binding transcriptional regulator AlpA